MCHDGLSGLVREIVSGSDLKGVAWRYIACLRVQMAAVFVPSGYRPRRLCEGGIALDKPCIISYHQRRRNLCRRRPPRKAPQGRAEMGLIDAFLGWLRGLT